MLDSLDYKILEHLSSNGRATWADLAHILGLSAPSTAERVKRLEEKRVIVGYSAILNHRSLGYSITAFIAVSLSHPKYMAGFLKSIEEMVEAEECHHVAGDDDYVLKVRCKDTKHLDNFLNENLKILPGILRTRTTIVLSSSKEFSIKKPHKI
jgi:Lrp/AsnC family leucine-responsive transcriptional regulator